MSFALSGLEHFIYRYTGRCPVLLNSALSGLLGLIVEWLERPDVGRAPADTQSLI